MQFARHNTVFMITNVGYMETLIYFYIKNRQEVTRREGFLNDE